MNIGILFNEKLNELLKQNTVRHKTMTDIRKKEDKPEKVNE